MESKWLTENADGSGANSANQNLAGNTEVLACHFLRPYYMDPGHPSRLPYGSLRSAWTGPGRDPRGLTYTRKWQAMFWHDLGYTSRWSGPNIVWNTSMNVYS